jgi:hypothetical protein
MSRKRTAADAELDKVELCKAEFPNLWQDAEREASQMYLNEAQYDAVPMLLAPTPLSFSSGRASPLVTLTRTSSMPSTSAALPTDAAAAAGGGGASSFFSAATTTH